MPRLLPLFLALAAFAPLRPAEIPIDPARPESLQAGIEAAASRGLPKVVVPPGIYRLPAKDDWHLVFRDLHDFEIDARGATFVLDDPYAKGIGFFGCRNVTLRGARVTRSHPASSQATITACDPAGNFVDIRVAKGYPADLTNRDHFPTFWAALYDARGAMLGGLRAKTPPEIEALAEPGCFRVRLYDTLPQVAAAIGTPVAPGMRLAWRGPVKDDIRPMDCEAMRFIDVTVAGGSGMVFHEMGGKGGNHYLRCRVTYPPRPAGADEDALFAACADGLHSHDTMKGPVVEGCLFEGLCDDAVAIHGTYAMATEAHGNRLVAWVFHETRDKLFCHPGEKLRFYDPQGRAAGEAVVTEARALPGYVPAFKPDPVYRSFQEPAKDTFVEVTLDRPAPALSPGSFVTNADRCGGGYVVRDTIIRNSTSRGVLPKGDGGLVEGCTFENLGRAGVEFMAETDVWSEADYSHDVVVRNNVFRRTPLNRQTGYLRQPGALTIFKYRAKTTTPDLTRREGEYVDLPGGHRNIVIEGNLFEEIDGPNVLVTSAKEIVFRNNRFVRPMRRDNPLGSEKGVETASLFWLTQCTGVVLSGNRIVEPGLFLKHAVTATETAQGTGFADGVVAPSQP
ncbi:MAG TPA: hypothetical protein VIM58_10330 [Candidatus Methylacidiphilales bacterium]